MYDLIRFVTGYSSATQSKKVFYDSYKLYINGMNLYAFYVDIIKHPLKKHEEYILIFHPRNIELKVCNTGLETRNMKSVTIISDILDEKSPLNQIRFGKCEIDLFKHRSNYHMTYLDDMDIDCIAMGIQLYHDKIILIVNWKS